ncbi:hypothetical protein ASD31_07030 [Rhizobium sp. Root482]|jgi:hypothetical protein|nr:hypothetical protein ASD31_07030 [Rhizobium sp. Root482]
MFFSSLLWMKAHRETVPDVCSPRRHQRCAFFNARILTIAAERPDVLALRGFWANTLPTDPPQSTKFID